jgi:hypothetical protein
MASLCLLRGQDRRPEFRRNASPGVGIEQQLGRERDAPGRPRRNWIHVGSQEAGPRVAAIISIVETCRRLGLPLRDYLGSVLPGLADFPIFQAIASPNSRPTLGPPEFN